MLTAITCNRHHVVIGYSADFYHDLPTLGTPKSDMSDFSEKHVTLALLPLGQKCAIGNIFGCHRNISHEGTSGYLITTKSVMGLSGEGEVLA
jgi:hypothetical protein